MKWGKGIFTVKAIVYSEYGPPDVLELKEVEKPAPKEDEVLIKVQAVSINGSDREGLAGRPLYARLGGLRRPGNPILGSDIAGKVEMAGRDIQEFHPGDEVFGEIPTFGLRLPAGAAARWNLFRGWRFRGDVFADFAAAVGEPGLCCGRPGIQDTYT
jgi:NADPH:quinone reductase-like Zn-dependent oxidoreductase